MKIPPLKTFIIYARKDEPYKDELLLHLKGTLVASGHLSVWQDGNILPGENWEDAILKNLEAADLFLVLVSIHTLNSGFIQHKELRTALQRKSRVVPILIRSCFWKTSAHLTELQWLPRNMVPVENYSNRDDAWTEIMEKLHDLSETIRAEEALAAADEAAFAAARSNADFEAYLRNYTLHAAEARQTLERLQNEEAEQRRIRADHDAYTAARTIPELEEYLKKYTLHINHARRRINILKEKEAEAIKKYMPEMVFIKGGIFQMGDIFGEGESNEKPVHSVTLGDFYLGKYAVTKAEFKKFMEDSDYRTDAKKEGWSYAWNGKKWEQQKSVDWKCDVNGQACPLH